MALLHVKQNPNRERNRQTQTNGEIDRYRVEEGHTERRWKETERQRGRGGGADRLTQTDGETDRSQRQKQSREGQTARVGGKTEIGVG